jgi:4-hydroxybenzoate polyprenyltransferase
LIELLRIHQYIKNLFIFAPLFFSFSFFLQDILFVIITFILFSAVASSVYVFNDLMDVSEDRNHPTKKYRPIASGKVSKNEARLLFFSLSSISFICAGFFNTHLFYVLLTYFILNIAYSLKLKHITIVDIFIIAVGFVLRLFAGASVINNQLSMWIIIITFLLALFLAVAKRRDDVILASVGKKTRKSIDGYNLEFVNAVMVFMAGVIAVSYILYTVSEDVIKKFQTQYLYLTSVFVVLGIIRYMQLTFVEQNSGSPSKIILKDRFLQLTIIIWLVSFVVIVKGGF